MTEFAPNLESLTSAMMAEIEADFGVWLIKLLGLSIQTGYRDS